jgi:hypothetical protein
VTKQVLRLPVALRRTQVEPQAPHLARSSPEIGAERAAGIAANGGIKTLPA